MARVSFLDDAHKAVWLCLEIYPPTELRKNFTRNLLLDTIGIAMPHQPEDTVDALPHLADIVMLQELRGLDPVGNDVLVQLNHPSDDWALQYPLVSSA